MIPELKWHARRKIRFLSAIFGVLCGVCSLVVLQPANATKFRLPLAADTAVHFYYDHDPTTSWQDWRCGTESYDGHHGTDFSGGPRGKPIYAGASGTVSYKIDGFGDGFEGSTDGGGFGNHVRLDHGNGLLTYYGHMTSGSVTTKSVGSNVTCGEQVGGVGTSGSSTGLHLHFEPRLNGVGFDPFSGNCNAIPTSWWVNQGTGSPAATCEAPTDKFLTYITPDTTKVYWIQNNKKDWVITADILNTMQSAGIPGWSWSSVYTVSTSYTSGPDFISTGSSSNGLYIRKYLGTDVYKINNGKKEYVSYDSCNQTNCWNDIIDVAQSILDMFPTAGSETLAVSLSASPSNGTVPLSTNLTADVSGTATETINYIFWWNCNDPGTIVSNVMAVCGSIPTSTAGTCTSNDNGYKCNAVIDDPKTVSHTYSSAGTYTAKVIAERGSASPAEARTNVAVNTPSDTTPPTVTITSPTSNPTYSTSSSPLSIGGTASDNVGVTQVTWSNDRGGSGTCSGTTSWSASGITLYSGQNVITVTARDAAGNTGTDTLTVTYTPPDTTPPTVTITSPTSNPTYSTSSSPLSIGGTASDNVGVTQVTWSNDRGGSGTCSGTTSWSASGITLYSGQNVITVAARDAAGNTGTDILTVTYTPPDVTPPTITITSPTSNPTYSTSQATINIGGTASDNVGVTQVTWSNSRGGSGTATGTTSWSVGGITLYSGDNIITVTARDAAGNIGTDTLTVTYTPPGAPSIRVISPNGGEIWTAGRIYAITWTSSNLNPAGGVYIFYWYNNSWQQIAGPLLTSSNSYSWTVPNTLTTSSWIYLGNWVNGAWEVSDQSDQAFTISSSTTTNKIVFSSNRDGNYQIYVMNPDGTNQTRLTYNNANDSYPSRSPGGTKIIFVSDRDGNLEIYAMNVDGTNQTRLTNNSAGNYGPRWSPNGTKIAFVSNRDGNYQIYVMNPDGADQTRLTNNSAIDDFPSWSPNGTKIVFTSSRSGTMDIYVINADGTNPVQLTNGRWANYTAWSPDGTKIALG